MKSTDHEHFDHNLQENKKRKVFLAKLTDRLRLLRNSKIIQQTAMELLAEELGLQRAVYFKVLPDGNTLELKAAYQKDVSPLPKHLQLSDFSNHLATDFLNGKTFVLNDSRYEAQSVTYQKIEVGSGVAVPLVKNGEFIALAAISAILPRNWTATELYLIEELAERTWAAAERAKAEEDLLNSQIRFQSIANLVPDLLWDSEPDGSTNWYNQRWLDYTGQSFEEAIGWGWIESIHMDDRQGSAQRYAEAMEKGVPLLQEHRIRRYDGIYRWFVVNTYPILDKNGRVIKMYGAATDIHDRREAEEAVRRSEEKYRTLFETIDEGFALMELLRDEHGQVTDLIYRDANHSFKSFTGWEDAIGKRGSELMPNLEPSLLKQMQIIADEAKSFRKEDYVADLNRWYDVHYSPIGGPGGNFIVAVFNNTTERKQAEQNLKESEGRQAFLLKMSDMLRPLNDSTIIQQTAANELLVEIDAGWVYYVSIDANGEKISAMEGASKTTRLNILPNTPVSAFGKFLASAYHGNKTLCYDDTQAHPDFNDSDRESFRMINAAAFISVPLIKNGNLVALLNVAVPSPRNWKRSEIELAEETAQRTWASVERAKAEATLKLTQSKYLIQLEKEVTDRTSKLQESNLLLKKSEEIAHLGSWNYNLETGIFSWSEGMYRLFDLEIDQEVVPEIYLKYSTPNGLFSAKRIAQRIRRGDVDFEETLEINVSNNIKTLQIKALSSSNIKGNKQRVLGIGLDISEIRAAEEKIHKMEANQKLEIFRTSLSTLEEERYRISESLHNGIGQILYGIKINLSALEPTLKENEFNEAKKYVNKLLTDVIIETRRISHELMPTTLEQFGLKSAIEDI